MTGDWEIKKLFFLKYLMLLIKSIVKIKMLDDATLDNILPPDETNLPFNIPFNIPFLNNQLKSDLFSDSIDLAHEKNEEDDFNTDYNQSFPYFFEDKPTDFQTRKKDNLTSLKNNNSDIKDLKIYTFEDISKILKENSLNNILDQFTKDELIEKYESNMKLLNQKRKRNRTKNKENKNENEEEKK